MLDLIALGWAQEIAGGRAPVVRELLERGRIPVLLVPMHLVQRGDNAKRRSRGTDRNRRSPEKRCRAARSGADRAWPAIRTRRAGCEQHIVFLSADEVVFVFVGHEVEWIVDGLVDEPFHWRLLGAIDDWRPLLEGNPRIARPLFTWKREVLDEVAAP